MYYKKAFNQVNKVCVSYKKKEEEGKEMEGEEDEVGEEQKNHLPPWVVGAIK